MVPTSEEKHISIPIRDLFTFVDIHGVHSNLERFASSESQPTASRSITLEKGVDARYLEWVTVTDTASAMQFDVPFNDLRDFVAFYIRLKLIERLHVMPRSKCSV